MLVTIVGVAAGWVSYQSDLIRQRREFANTLDADNDLDPNTKAELSRRQPNPISLVRRILGDHGYGILVLPEKYDQRLIDKANELFPEALIWRWGGHYTGPYGGESEFTIDVTNHSENKRLHDDYKLLPSAASIQGFSINGIAIKDNRRISIRDESVEKAMQADRLSVP